MFSSSTEAQSEHERITTDTCINLWQHSSKHINISALTCDPYWSQGGAVDAVGPPPPAPGGQPDAFWLNSLSINSWKDPQLRQTHTLTAALTLSIRLHVDPDQPSAAAAARLLPVAG